MADYYTSPKGIKVFVGGLTGKRLKNVMALADKGDAAKASALAKTYIKELGAAGKAAPSAKYAGQFDKSAELALSQQVQSGAITQAQMDGEVGRLKGLPSKTLNGPGPVDLGVNDLNKTPVIDDKTATGTIAGAVQDDFTKTFNANNPGQQTDALGNMQSVTLDPTTGQTSITKTAGAGLTAANNAFVGATNDFAGNGKTAAQQARDANYSYITQHYGEQKAQEMEAKKQELAQRGIPLDPSPTSLYGRSLAQIDQKYQAMDDQAKNQSLVTGDQSYSTQAGVVSTLGSTVSGQNPNFTAFQGGNINSASNFQSLLGTMSSAELAKYGIDQDMIAKLKQIDANKSIANKAAEAAKSSGGGGGGDSVSFGGTAP